MSARYRPEDYLYASARVRALENKLVGNARIRQLLEMKSAEDLRAALAAMGYVGEVEQMLHAMLREGFDTVCAALPDPAVVAFLQYPYDTHNLKVLLKCAIRRVDPTPLLIDAGTLPAAELPLLLAQNDAKIPAPLREGARAARECYDETKNPQEIDFVLDRACFSAMYESASAVPFAQRLVAQKADLVNLQILLRVMRLAMGEVGHALLLRALVPHGTLGEAWFSEAYGAGEGAFPALLACTPYAALWGEDNTPAALEKRADDLLMAEVGRAKYIAFGAEVPIAYLWGLDTAVRDLRILWTGLVSGADRETIATRVRECYV
ncbi:MAG: V-type ATPase subunit [Clostridia bacterium]|nr:V-type ATPase subunit [Clostridia bacterium]